LIRKIGKGKETPEGTKPNGKWTKKMKKKRGSRGRAGDEGCADPVYG